MKQLDMYGQGVPDGNPPTLTGGLAFQDMAIEAWSGHIDYFTGTCEDHRGQQRFPDQEALQALIEAYGTESMKVWRMQDYNGYSIGKVHWAERSTGSIRQITSQLANQYVSSVESLLDVPICTRLDITVDIRFATDTALYVSSIATERSEHSSAKRLGQPLLMHSYGDGDTFYVGSPSSAKRLRVYDKYRESGCDERYKNTIRYELQLRSPHSDGAFNILRMDKNRQWTILSTVTDHCKHKLVHIPVIPSDVPPMGLRIAEVEKTVDRQLEWLASQVAPTVRRLVLAGHKDRVMAALGLTNEADVGNIRTWLERVQCDAG